MTSTFLASACTGQPVGKREETAAVKTLRVGNAEEPDSLDPQKASSLAALRIAQDLFLGLMTIDSGGRAILGAAETHEIEQGGRVHRFSIRRHSWSDGTVVTADDFVRAWRRAIDPATASPSAHLLYVLENAQAISNGEKPLSALGVRAARVDVLELTLARPTPYLAELLTQPITAPIPPRTGGGGPPNGRVTNGPYQLVDFRPGEFVHLRKSRSFYDVANVAIEEIYYYPTVDDSAAVRRFRAGELDISLGWPIAQRDFLRSEYANAVHMAPLLASVWIACNLAHTPLADLRVRQALALALDRESLIAHLLGTGQQAAYRLVPPFTPRVAARPVTAPFATTPVAERQGEARRLLAAAGFGPGNPLRLRYAGLISPEGRALGVALRSMWKSIGVEVDVHLLNPNSHYTALQAGDFQLGFVNWQADIPDPYTFLSALFSETGNYINTRYHSEAFDGWMRSALQQWDEAARSHLLAEAEDLALRDLPFIPLYFDSGRAIVSTQVQGFADNMFLLHPARWMNLH
jgi:ABC-type oligopeptide transport system substrate-binding subunit